MILKPKTISTDYSGYIIKNEIVLEYLKWMNYIPKHWNVEELLNKQASELSQEEIEILNMLKLENEHKSIFQHYVSIDKKDNSILSKVLNYINQISIEQYAKKKLTNSEIEYCNRKVEIYINKDIDRGISMLQEKENRDIKEEYILYKLLKAQFDFNLNSLNMRIKNDIKKIHEQRIKGLDSLPKTRSK